MNEKSRVFVRITKREKVIENNVENKAVRKLLHRERAREKNVCFNKNCTFKAKTLIAKLPHLAKK